MNKKGVILITVFIFMAVMLILVSAYFSGLFTEKKSVNTEKFVIQALNLAEAGANHGLAELRERIRSDLNANAQLITSSAVFQTYITNEDSLGFLRDFAFSAGKAQFNIADNSANISVSSADANINLNTGVQGNYTAVISVTSNGLPTKDPSGQIYYFSYDFSIDATGLITASNSNVQKNVSFNSGNFRVTVRRDNFSKFALFTSHHSTPSGTTVWFTSNTNFTGPVSTNTRFSFANNPSGHFTENVTQHETKARFYNSGSPVLLNADFNAIQDVPVFDKGFERSYDLINLPSSLSQADLKDEALGTLSEPGANGIYVPNNGAALTGGIYVKGNASVNMNVNGDDNPVYTVTQGSTTKTITVDYANNQTVVQEGASTQTYQGLPDGVGNEGVILYAKGNINSFAGTVQKDSKVTISSERDIVITNNVQYQQYNAGSPLNASGYANVLGILSWGGDVRIGTAAPNDVSVHGVVMAPHGKFSVDNYNSGSPRGIATLLGGAITDFYGAFGTFSGTSQVSGYGRNFVYDGRMLEGVAPPYFPYMSNFTSFDDNNLDNKLLWQEKVNAE